MNKNKTNTPVAFGPLAKAYYALEGWDWDTYWFRLKGSLITGTEIVSKDTWR